MPQDLEKTLLARQLLQQPEQPATQVPLPNKPIKDEDAFWRLLAGAEEGIGVPVDATGSGPAGLLGYGLGGAASSIGSAAVIPKKMWATLAEKVIGNTANPQVKESLEYLLKEKKIPGIIAHMTKADIGPVPGAYASANSEFEYRVADLAMQRLRSAGITEPTVDQQLQAIGEMRQAMQQNLSPERVENLSKVYRIKVDPTAHQNFFDVLDSTAHEVTHGAQMIRQGQEFHNNYQAYQQLEKLLGGAGKTSNPYEKSAEGMASKVVDRYREQYRNWQRANMLNQAIDEEADPVRREVLQKRLDELLKVTGK